jgi:hypothetical protein
VIKLLWRKRKLADKGTKTRNVRLTKPISGLRAFNLSNKNNGLTRMESKMRWMQLPLERRVYWRNCGNPSMVAKKSPSEMRSTMKLTSRAGSNSMHNLDFLRTKMM